MFDRITKRIPWVVAAVMAAAVIGVPAAAQSGVNADRVDGRHAVKYTTNLDLRGGRLMSFNKAGYLPSDIVQGGVATIAALQSATGAVNEADNPVHWNQIQGVPAKVVNGTTVTVIFDTKTIGAAPAGDVLGIWYPATMNVHYELYPVTPGGAIGTTGDIIVRSADSAWIAKLISFVNLGAAPVTVRVRITAFNADYVSPARLKDDIKVKFLDRLPKRFRR